RHLGTYCSRDCMAGANSDSFKRKGVHQINGEPLCLGASITVITTSCSHRACARRIRQNGSGGGTTIGALRLACALYT
ncbi:MAG TPA: hypothetical protein PLQ42_06315, partial [Candidatus Hydrogenedentes bacterium]|nr:hypothetical protein [Candidatus Hydrogenedentota bacterium]